MAQRVQRQTARALGRVIPEPVRHKAVPRKQIYKLRDADFTCRWFWPRNEVYPPW
jgi:hypothetical protein